MYFKFYLAVLSKPNSLIVLYGFMVFSLTEVYSESFWVYSVHWRICDLHWRLPWKKVRCRPGRQGSAWHVGHVDICSPESRVWRPGSVWNWGIGTWKVGIQPRAAAVGRCPGAQGRLGVVALDWWARLLDWLGIGIIGSYGMVYIAPSSDIPQICWPHPEQANWAQHSKMQSNWRTPSDWKDLIGHRTGLRWVMGQVMQLIANDIQIHPGWPRKKWCDKCAGSLYVPINVRSTGCVGGTPMCEGQQFLGSRSIRLGWTSGALPKDMAPRLAFHFAPDSDRGPGSLVIHWSDFYRQSLLMISRFSVDVIGLRTFSSDSIDFAGSPSGSSERCETGILWVAASTPWVSMGTGFQYPIDPMSCYVLLLVWCLKSTVKMVKWCLFCVRYIAVPSCPNWWIRFHGSTVFHRKSDNIFKVPQQLWRRSHMPPLPQEAMYDCQLAFRRFLSKKLADVGHVAFRCF